MRLTRSDCRKIVEEMIHSPLSEDIEDSCWDMPTTFKETHRWHVEKPPMFEISGFSKLCELIGGGFSHRGFTAITGPTGAGKSTLTTNWFVNMAMNMNGYVVPIEIGPRAFMDSCVSIVTGQRRKEVGASSYEKINHENFAKRFFSNKGCVLAKHESRLSHLDFLAEIYYHIKTRNIRFAIGDNWSFMLEPAKGHDAIAQNDSALHDVIVFSKMVDCHIFMVFHPRKPDSRADERVESVYDIKGSSTIIQEATNVLIFNRLGDEENAPYDSHKAERHEAAFCREISIGKARWNGRARGSKVIYTIDDKSEMYSEHQVIS